MKNKGTVTVYLDYQLHGKWKYRATGRILPNCLCNFASGSRDFSSAFLALKWARDHDVEIANKGQFPRV